jgi:hypothetical protein
MYHYKKISNYLKQRITFFLCGGQILKISEFIVNDDDAQLYCILEEIKINFIGKKNLSFITPNHFTKNCIFRNVNRLNIFISLKCFCSLNICSIFRCLI